MIVKKNSRNCLVSNACFYSSSDYFEHSEKRSKDYNVYNICKSMKKKTKQRRMRTVQSSRRRRQRWRWAPITRIQRRKLNKQMRKIISIVARIALQSVCNMHYEQTHIIFNTIESSERRRKTKMLNICWTWNEHMLTIRYWLNWRQQFILKTRTEHKTRNFHTMEIKECCFDERIESFWSNN